MNNTEKFDLTSGKIIKKLMFIAMPIMGTQFLQMAYNMLDMLWMGRLGSDALAATAAGGMYLWLSVGITMIGRMGAEIGVSQSIGAGDKEKALQYSRTSMHIAIILGTLYAVIMMVFTDRLVGFFNLGDNRVIEQAYDYLWIVAVGVPGTMVVSVATGTFNAAGNSKTPFMLNLVGIGLNLIFDPLLIFGFGWGVRGAAISTSSAQIFVAIMMLAALKRDRSRPFERYSLKFKPSRNHIEIVKQIFRWSIPVAIESTLFCALAMITTRMQAGFGSYAVAVSHVGSQMESLSWLIGGGFGTALVAFVGQNFGAKKHERIKEGMRLSALMMLIWGIGVTMLLLFGGEVIMSLFIIEKELIPIGVIYFQIACICQIPMNLEVVVSSTFKGTGRTLPPSAVTIGSNIFRVILAYFMSGTALGLYGIWIAITISCVLRCIVMWIWYILTAKKRTIRSQ